MGAFEHFGGVPAVVVPDNLKSAVIRAAFTPSEPTTLNRSYRELARHYGFKVAPTPPRSPEKKGRVESGVKYVKNNFFAARPDERSADVLARELVRWVLEVAGMRIHGTTRERPLEVTSNRDIEEWPPLFGDALLASAAQPKQRSREDQVCRPALALRSVRT